jgi:hypothetical protein
VTRKRPIAGTCRGLAGLRSIISTGWDAEAIGTALLATVGVAIVSLALALWALRGRVANG